MELTENTIFDSRYRLLRLLGCGGFSEVWLAEDTRAGIRAALKIYAPGQGLDEDGVRLFSREFSMVFNLNHSNLLRPSYFDVCNRTPYLVMPFCVNGSAMKLAGRITEQEAWKFLHDVAAGLAYLHEQEPPVIHQDIKPDNVLVNSNGDFLITDFGVSAKIRSTLRKSLQKKNSMGGATSYMGPERFGRDNYPVKASDVWALGAATFELMTGETPFGNHGGLLQKSGVEIPRIHENYSRQLKSLVYKCLAPEPWDRPFAEQIAKQAELCLKGENPPEFTAPSAASAGMNGFQCYIKAFRHYASFGGRAGRREFWYFFLFNLLFSTALTVLDNVLGFTVEELDRYVRFGEYGCYGYFSLALAAVSMLPNVSLTVRRLHDTGKSAWRLLLAFVPVIGWIMLLAAMLQKGDGDKNRYGAVHV